MRRGICVKCQASSIYQLPCRSAGSYQDLWLGGPTVFSPRSSFFLVCGSCGYAERYVNPELMSKLDKYGRRVSPRA